MRFLPGEPNSENVVSREILACDDNPRAMQVVGSIAKRLLDVDSPDDLIAELFESLSKELELEVYFHYLYEPEEHHLQLHSFGGVSQAVASQYKTHQIGEAVCGKVAQICMPVLMENVDQAAEDDEDNQDINRMGVKSYMCNPLIAHGELIGTLFFGTRNRPRITGPEQRLLRVLSDLIALALQRSRIQAHREALLASEQQARLDLQKLSESLRELNETLEQRVADRTQALTRHRSQLRTLVSNLTLNEQRERRRYATQLHDKLAQLLVAAKMNLAMLKLDLGEQSGVSTSLSELDMLVGDSLTYTRTLIAQLSPRVLFEHGLAPAIEWLSSEVLRPQGLIVTVEDHNGHDLRDELRIILFDSVRELLLNVMQHAGVDRAHVTLRHRDQGLEVVVEDQGKGFSPDDYHIADDDHQQMGLFMVQERIALLGGRFAIRSVLGKGTQATMWVPLGEVASESDSTFTDQLQQTSGQQVACPPPRERASSATVNVMLVDDHDVVREGLQMMLSREEDLAIVAQARSGSEALELARQKHPDVVVMDVNMPGMNGIAATQQLTAMLPGVAVVGLSMADDEAACNAMHEAGAVAHLSKGCSLESLAEAIRAAAHH